jgi:hypothetical protein
MKKVAKKIAAPQLPAQPEEILFGVKGKMSTFGGPHDLGMAANEDLALFTRAGLQDPKYAYLIPEVALVGKPETGTLIA